MEILRETSPALKYLQRLGIEDGIVVRPPVGGRGADFVSISDSSSGASSPREEASDCGGADEDELASTRWCRRALNERSHPVWRTLVCDKQVASIRKCRWAARCGCLLLIPGTWTAIGARKIIMSARIAAAALGSVLFLGSHWIAKNDLKRVHEMLRQLLFRMQLGCFIVQNKVLTASGGSLSSTSRLAGLLEARLATSILLGASPAGRDDALVWSLKGEEDAPLVELVQTIKIVESQVLLLLPLFAPKQQQRWWMRLMSSLSQLVVPSATVDQQVARLVDVNGRLGSFLNDVVSGSTGHLDVASERHNGGAAAAAAVRCDEIIRCTAQLHSDLVLLKQALLLERRDDDGNDVLQNEEHSVTDRHASDKMKDAATSSMVRLLALWNARFGSSSKQSSFHPPSHPESADATADSNRNHFLLEQKAAAGTSAFEHEAKGEDTPLYPAAADVTMELPGSGSRFQLPRRDQHVTSIGAACVEQWE